MYSKIRHHPHPLGYLCAKWRFFRSPNCWASPWRKIVYSINQSINQLVTHSAYMMPREPKLSLQNIGSKIMHINGLCNTNAYTRWSMEVTTGKARRSLAHSVCTSSCPVTNTRIPPSGCDWCIFHTYITHTDATLLTTDRSLTTTKICKADKHSRSCEGQLAWKCLFMSIFRLAIMIHKVG